MKICKPIFLILLFLFSLPEASGQKKIKEFLLWADSLWTDYYYDVSCDTNYLVLPQNRFFIKTESSFSGFLLHDRSEDESGVSSGRYRTSTNFRLNASFSYHGISFGLSASPSSIFHHQKYKEYELGFKVYSSRYVFDFNYFKSSTLSGSISMDGDKVPLQKGEIRMRLFTFSSFYVFNNKRFSFPAAFSQSFVQKKSAGSVIAGFAFQGGLLRLLNEENEEYPIDIRAKMSYLGVGVGYGYNLVFGKNWLFHTSILPTITIHNKIYTHFFDEREKERERGPIFIVNARVAIVKTLGPRLRLWGAECLLGASFESNSIVRYRESSSYIQTKWNSSLFFGVKF